MAVFLFTALGLFALQKKLIAYIKNHLLALIFFKAVFNEAKITFNL